MKKIVTTTPAATQALAEQIAQHAKPGLVIVLNGDLGAGKTTFTQGFARALGVRARVKSPTFNIMNSYTDGDLPIYHFDAYRLEETGAQDQGFEEFIGTDGVTLIEWAQFMAELLPQDRLILSFERIDDDARSIIIEGKGRFADIEAQLS